MQNSNTYQIAEIIIEEHFSNDVLIIASFLMNNGSSSILDICKHTNLDFQSVRNSLIILLQNMLITFEEVKKKNFIEIQYTINLNNILNYIRFPKILYFINARYGENAVLIFEEIMQCGILSAKQCIEQVQFKLKNLDKVNPLILNSVKVTFVQLIENNYLIQAFKTKNESKVKNNELSNKKDKSKL